MNNQALINRILEKMNTTTSYKEEIMRGMKDLTATETRAKQNEVVKHKKEREEQLNDLIKRRNHRDEDLCKLYVSYGDGSASAIDGYTRIRKEMEVKDERWMSPTLSHEDYGPQRWSVNRDKLIETNEDGTWADEHGELFSTQFDDILYRPDYKIEEPKARRELNKEELSWLAAHEHLLEEESVSIDAPVEYKEYIGDDSDVYTDNGDGMEIGKMDSITSTDNTEESLEELRFWRRMVWYIGHSPNKAVSYCKRYSNAAWFTKEKKEYVWELIKDEEPRKWKYAKYLIMKSKAVVENLQRNSLEPKKEKKGEIVVHLYKSIKSCREGFVRVWTTDGVLDMREIKFLDNKYPKEELKRITSRAKAVGYKLSFVDVTHACLDIFNRTPHYKKVRAMNDEDYKKATLKQLV